MSLTAGIVGLPNVGKSTLFNAITKKNILAANYPFATIDPNVGVVTVPDSRLVKLEEMYIPDRTIPTIYEFTDIAGLVKGASNGEGLGNKFLSHIREVDAIVEVVRCFDDNNIIHVDGSVDPIRDIEVINVELILSDLEIITSRINKIGKKAMTTKNKDDLKEIELLNRIKDGLERNIPARKLGLDEEEKETIKANVLHILKENYGIEEEDFASAELEIVPAGKARDCGFDRSMILSYGQDDRVCAFTSLFAMLDVENAKRTGCCLLVDKEEIGSVGATGMHSRFFENTVAELVALTEGESELKVRRALANSRMLSSDVSAAYDPMFAEAFEKEYVSQGYETDRSIEETLNIGWKLLSILPRAELKRIDDKWLDMYYGK